MKIGRHAKYDTDKGTDCLTTDQARHIYKKVKLEGIAYIDTMKQEMEDEKLTREKDKEINPYQRTVVNNIDKENVKTSQMVHWTPE